MELNISRNKLINDLQQDFNKAFPYLKLEFYSKSGYTYKPGKTHLPHSFTLAQAGLKHEGILQIDDQVVVGDLEKKFKDDFGILVQVSRQSGILWLETTMTDKWTLKQQNDHGMELSVSQKQSPPGINNYLD